MTREQIATRIVCGWSIDDGDDALIYAIEAALKARDERAAQIARGREIIGLVPIGPLYGIGWNSAVKSIAAAILDEERE